MIFSLYKLNLHLCASNCVTESL